MTLYDDTEPYRSIAATMARFDFTRPVTAEDLTYVRAELETAAPGARVIVEPAWPCVDDVVRVDVHGADGLPAFGRLYFAR